MSILIKNLAIAGYRSFGLKPQYFEKFTKINIFIGQNNAGKSNVLRFINEVYSRINEQGTINFDPLARHLPDKPPILLGVGEAIDLTDPTTPLLANDHRLVEIMRTQSDKTAAARIFGKFLFEKAKIDGTTLCWTLLTLPDRKDTQPSWLKAAKTFHDHDMERAFEMLTRMHGGNRTHEWEPRVIAILPATIPTIRTQLIPAIRQIGASGSSSEAFDGTGIIERLAKLQNPDVHSQDSRQAFNSIQEFLRDVINRPTATIEIPYERNTILVHMDSKVLPVESLGSGIHEVLIIAAAATVLSDHVVCVEEPELHLNPVLQKKLVRYLSYNTSNQYFITTHSAALMDTPSAEVYHVRLSAGQSVVERATSDQHRSSVCEDLGYHPSDLLQANCVIWVEGPSDRIYVNWWLRKLDPEISEGINYSIMFYGGRLASHLSNSQETVDIDDFISLRRLNRRGVMLIDSDRNSPRKKINATKLRLKTEFDSGPGHAWITEGREIENYLASDQIVAALAAVHPRATPNSLFGKHDHLLTITNAGGKEVVASKVEVARYISENFDPDFALYDLKQQVQLLRNFILESNPKTMSEPNVA